VSLLSRIIFTIIATSIFLLLVFVTFVTNTSNYFEKPYYTELNNGTYELIKNTKDIFSIKNIESKNDNSILVKQIWLSNKIIYSTGSISVGENTIKIDKWLYFFDLRELESKYKIEANWFEIEKNWPWIFVVNTLNPKNNIVFSITSLLNLKLNDIDTNENITDLDLYPHSYLIFNPKKNTFVKNSDLLKISQTFSLWYFNEKIYKEENINQEFQELITIKDENYKQLVNYSLLSIKQDYFRKKKLISSFLLNNFWTIPWETLINKYFSYFINDNKKRIYYKNKILRDLNVLIKSKPVLPTKINNINNDLQILKTLNKEDYIEMENIISYFYSLILLTDSELNTKINITKLVYKISNKEFKLKNKSLSFLDSLFLKYNFSEENDFHYKLNTFNENYFSDLKIDIYWNNEKLSINNFEKIDYFLFFQKNILLWDYSEKNTSDLLSLFNDYVTISNYYYGYSDDKIKRTWLFTNSQILNKLRKIIKNKYFFEERNEYNLLEIKDIAISDKDNIEFLQKNIKKLISFFKDYESILNPDKNNKDKFLIKLYSNIEKGFEEYFIALLKNSEYLIKYNKTKSELLSTKTINEQNDDDKNILSKEKVNSYLNEFYWIYLSNSKVKIMGYNYCMNPEWYDDDKIDESDDFCYKIENIQIDNKSISFLLYPNIKNKIDYIYINDKSVAQSYKLDEIKIQWESKSKSSSQEDKEDRNKYNFAYFLKNTFWEVKKEDKNTNIVDNDEDNNILEESAIVKIFKRNKLLWNSWDFSYLDWFLDINYNNLIVKEKDNDYDIFVKNIELKVNTKKNKIYDLLFSSNYDFSNKHSFINPVVKFIDKKNDRDLLLWNNLNIYWEYNIIKIKDEIIKPIELYEQIDSIVNSISQKLRVHSIKISYYKNVDSVNFEVNYNNENVFLELNNWHITKARYKKESLIENKLTIKNIDLIFNKIRDYE
jgi:hypothetical protein